METTSLDHLISESKENRYRLLGRFGDNPREFVQRFYIESDGEILSEIVTLNQEDLCDIFSPERDQRIDLIQLGPGGKIGVPFLVTTPVGQYIIKKSKLTDLRMDFSESPPGGLDDFNRRFSASTCFFPDTEKLNYIGSDEFTNEMLVAYIIDYAFSIRRLPTFYVRHYSATVCEVEGEISGLNLMEFCDLGTLESFIQSPEIESYREIRNVEGLPRKILQPVYVREIFKQLIVALHFLTTSLDFIHGDSKVGNVFVKSDPIEFIHQGVKLSAPFTCKIADYGKSSLSVINNQGELFRIYNKNQLADFYLDLIPFEPNLGIFNGIPYYIVDDTLNLTLYAKLRHMGIPFFRSYDLYTLIISLLVLPEIHYAVFTERSLLESFWIPLFLDDEDRGRVFERIKEIMDKGREHVPFPEIVDALKGIKLRCSLASHLLNLM